MLTAEQDLAGCSRDVAGNYSGNAVGEYLAGSSRDLAGSRGQKQWRCIMELTSRDPRGMSLDLAGKNSELPKFRG